MAASPGAALVGLSARNLRFFNGGGSDRILRLVETLSCHYGITNHDVDDEITLDLKTLSLWREDFVHSIENDICAVFLYVFYVCAGSRLRQTFFRSFAFYSDDEVREC